ncbi:CHAT domain-containing protein [Aquimarina algicola]|uniref:CHAT domain-containing protein n=1 Tax=Aquimarina algicola TaxID=2589995 RepID=A0A504J9Z2_9FLAO|nr:CHAT domain-containing protein [Aquimarina algicola]TPN87697.1 CHAT domain-containing protein [Aquimarina algicola]
MICKSILVLSLLLFHAQSFYGQQQEKLRSIIASNASIEVRQQQLDSFFLIEKDKIPLKVLADCYHDYSLRWCYGVQWRKAGNNSFSEQAIEYAKKALKIRENLSDRNTKDLKNTLFNIGYFNYLKENYFEAIKAFSDLVDLEHTDTKTMDANRMLGNAYTKIGDFYKALRYFDKVIAFCQKDTLNSKLLLRTYINRSSTYTSIGYLEFPEQINADLNKADSILKNTGIQDNLRKTSISLMRGNFHIKNNEFQKGISFFKKALVSLSEKDSVNIAKVYNSLGLSQLKLDKFAEAIENIQKSIAYNPNYSSPYENLGDYYIKKKKYKEGLSSYQKAIDIILQKKRETLYTDLVSKEELEVIADKDRLLGHLISKANGWVTYYRHDLNKNHLEKALQTFILADHLADLIRFESTEYKSKLYWREKGAVLYMNAVEVCYLLEKPKKAYYFIEKNKAILLLEDITHEQAKKNAKLPDHIAKREFDLKRKIYLSENNLQNTNTFSKDSITILKNKIYNHKQAHEKFVDSLAKAYPNYAEIKKKPTIIPYTFFKEKYIADNEVVLQYILNKEKGFGILHTPLQTIFFKINNTKQLCSNVINAHQQMAQPFMTRDDLSVFQRNTHFIFSQLIPQNVYNLIQDKKLTIVPDHILQQLPFEALSTHPQKLHYFIKDVEIKYVYSMSYLDRNRHMKRNPKKEFVGFAPITFKNSGLSNLSLSKNEIETIKKIYSGDLLIHKHASKTNFLDTINNYKIIHLSTHADIGETSNPWIAFANQKVSLNEIYATKNQSDLVVLSACKTSLGELQEGEGVMSLARGFFHSGTKSVVSSLWSTNDKANQELLINFYKNLSKGLTKSAALRNAKLDYIKNHEGSEKSPFYWAPLVLIGDNAPIPPSPSFSIWTGLTIICIILIVITFIYYNKKLKH